MLFLILWNIASVLSSEERRSSGFRRTLREFAVHPSWVNRHFPDKQPIYPRFVGRIARVIISEQHQEVGLPPEPGSIAGRTHRINRNYPDRKHGREGNPACKEGSCCFVGCHT